jgi:hypothetical protein
MRRKSLGALGGVLLVIATSGWIPSASADDNNNQNGLYFLGVAAGFGLAGFGISRLAIIIIINPRLGSQA